MLVRLFSLNSFLFSLRISVDYVFGFWVFWLSTYIIWFCLFQGWDRYWGLPRSLLCLTNVSVFNFCFIFHPTKISEYVPLNCSARSRSLPRRPASSTMMHYNPNGNVPHYVTLSRAALVESGDARMFEQHRYVIDSLFRQDSCVHKYVRWRTGSSHSNWLNLKVLNFSNLEFNFDSLPMLK